MSCCLRACRRERSSCSDPAPSLAQPPIMVPCLSGWPTFFLHIPLVVTTPLSCLFRLSLCSQSQLSPHVSPLKPQLWHSLPACPGRQASQTEECVVMVLNIWASLSLFCLTQCHHLNTMPFKICAVFTKSFDRILSFNQITHSLSPL